ncbi:MAG: 2-hydroxyacid dehydrogenase [Rhizobiaceae bacterium]|nr:2-hydroxyacid dehydrogenase [Rhizobiaceae bacterium]
MSKPVILVPGAIYEHVVKRVEADFELLRVDSADLSLLDETQKVSIRGIASAIHLPNDFIAGLPSLEIIAHFGVGYDVIDAKFAGEHNIMVCNTPDVLSEEVADTTIGLLLNTLRELPKAEAHLRRGDWVNKGNYRLTPLTLRNRIVGIYGLGRIGQEIATRLEGFGVGIHYHTRTKKNGVSYQYHETLLDMANAVDTLISIVPGTPATTKSIDTEILAALGSNGVFINVGRGSVVDEDALIKALENKSLAAAGLDVFENEPDPRKDFLSLENVSLLPHVASASVHTRNAMGDLQVDNLVNWFGGKSPISPVPETAHILTK